MKWKAQSKSEQIEDILNRKINEKSISSVKQFLSSAINKSGSEYIDQIVDSALKNTTTNRELFTIISNIVVYFRVPEAKTFRERMEDEYYLPNTLINLSPSDKLPEIFEQSIPENEKEFMAGKIKADINNNVRKIATSVFHVENPTASRDIYTGTIFRDRHQHFVEKEESKKVEAKKASPSGRAQAIEAIEKQPLVIPNLWSSILQNLNELELKSKSSESKSSEEDEDDDETEDEDDESKESDDESKETKESEGKRGDALKRPFENRGCSSPDYVCRNNCKNCFVMIF